MPERINERINRVEEKIDKILDIISQQRIDNSRNTYCLLDKKKKGLVERVEDLEDTQEKHTRYFWLINIIYVSVCSICAFIINKIWK